MSSLYFVRHGQAGLRHSYDSLSDLGREQARLLGAYLAAQNTRFTALYSGALERQRQTAEEFCCGYQAAGLRLPDLIVDPHWNEFDLDQVYRELAPALSAADADFRAEYERLRRLVRDEDAAIHRSWSPCDRAIVRAWIEGKHAVQGESWSAFRSRVAGCRDDLKRYAPGETVGVFTSATPIAVWMGMALGLVNGQLMRLAGVIYNSGLTTFRLRGDDLKLFSFNGTPHLRRSDLRTFR